MDYIAVAGFVLKIAPAAEMLASQPLTTMLVQRAHLRIEIARPESARV